jgi:hypothetical protein
MSGIDEFYFRGVPMRAAPFAAVLVGLCAHIAPAAAKDLGFGELTQQIANATKGTPAIIPFIERPPSEDTGLGGRAQAFGYLGSVANPLVAYPLGSDGALYYRASTEDKCNPDSFAFPAGQKGLQKFVNQTFFKFELKGGELTFKGANPGDKAFSISAVSARVLQRVKITISDLKEYTLDFRTLRERVAQVSADPACANFKQALTKVYEGKITATYYFEAGAEAGIKADLAANLNFSLGIAAVTQNGGSEADPNVLQFESEARVFAGRFRPVAEILGRAPTSRPRRVAGNN